MYVDNIYIVAPHTNKTHANKYFLCLESCQKVMDGNNFIL